MDFQVISMGQEHIDGVFALENECFSKPWNINDIKAQLENENAHFLVAVCENSVVGYIGIYEYFESCEIANLAVTRNFRKHGIASALIEKAETDAKARNREYITLEVRKSNLPAISLYNKFGFENAGTRKNFYSSPVEDAIIMTKFFKEK